MASIPTQWGKLTTQATQWAKQTINGSKWQQEDINGSAGYILLQNGSKLLLQDSGYAKLE